MEGDEPQHIVDLGRYRKARRVQAERVRTPSRNEPILGGRSRAGVILVLIILGLIAWWLILGRF